MLQFEVDRHMAPSFFIVGFQKCGTSSLYDLITSHPNVKKGLVKENNILAERSDRIDEFRLCFPINRKGKITGDASHLHTWMPYGLERIKEHFPSAKIIVIMRNPIDRAFSHFNMDQRIGYLPESLTFGQLIDIELRLRDGLTIESSAEDTYTSLRLYGNKYGWPLSRGLYHVYIQRLNDLGMDFLPLFMEDLESDYADTMNRVFNYLEITPLELSPKQSNKGVYKSNLDPKIRKQLEDFYELPNQKLAALLQRSLPW